MKNWIIGIANSESDGIVFRRFEGSLEEAKHVLMEMVREDRAVELDAFDTGTESEAELEYVTAEKRYDAFSNFHEYHIDYSLSEVESIPEVTICT